MNSAWRRAEPQSRRVAAKRLAAALGLGQIRAAGQSGAAKRVRLMISSSVVGDINENDAKAAMKVWASALTGGTSFEVERDYPRIVPVQEVVPLIRRGEIEAMAIGVREYMHAANMIVPNMLVIDETTHKGQWKYQVLVHADSGITNLAGLKGRSLVVWKNPRMLLARDWLELRLAEQRLGPSEGFFSQTTEATKVSRGAVLPVFFRQTDACLVAAPAFEGLCELNPQLGKRLRPIAQSAAMAPNFFCFHRNFAPAARDSFHATILKLHETVPGKQALTLFQSSRLVSGDTTFLKGTEDLIEASERLWRARGVVRP